MSSVFYSARIRKTIATGPRPAPAENEMGHAASACLADTIPPMGHRQIPNLGDLDFAGF
jgi:hypothetical protein